MYVHVGSTLMDSVDFDEMFGEIDEEHTEEEQLERRGSLLDLAMLTKLAWETYYKLGMTSCSKDHSSLIMQAHTIDS